MLLVHQFEFQKGRAPDQIFGPLGVLDAGQLDDDAIVALG